MVEYIRRTKKIDKFKEKDITSSNNIDHINHNLKLNLIKISKLLLKATNKPPLGSHPNTHLDHKICRCSG